MPDLAEDDIRRAVSRNAFEAGRAYEAEGRVTGLRVQSGPSRAVVEASVQGNARRPYHVHAEVRTRRSGTEMDGECSCPVGYNCKHVAAALLAALRRQDGALLLAEAARAPRAQAAAPEPAALPGDVAAWLHAIERAREDETEDYPPGVRKRLLYVLRLVTADGLDRLGIDLVGIELRRDGSVADRVTRYGPHQFSYGQSPRFLRPSDRAILRGIARLSSAGVADSAAPALLRQIIATGRGRWGRVDGPVLREGEPRPGRLAWRLGANGTQRLALEVPNLDLDADSTVPVLVGEPWYAEPGTGMMGPLEIGLPTALLRAVLAAPAVAPGAAERVGAEIARRLPGFALPAPQPVAPARPVGGQPTPCLQLYGAPLGWHGRGAVFRSDGDASTTPLARLHFLYDDVPVPASPRASSSTVLHEGQLYRVSRDRAAEDAAWAALASLGLRRLGATGPHEDNLVLDDEAEAWLDIVLDDVPALRRAGWRVEVDASFPVRLVEPEGDLEAELSEGTGEDWFELRLGTMVDGERVDLVPLLLALIASGDAERALRDEPGGGNELPLLLPLADGRLLALPMARVRPILATLVELHAGGGLDPEGGVRLLPRNAALLAALDEEAEAAGLRLRGGEALRQLGRALRDGEGIPHAEVPAAFQAQLRPYQQRGVDWLQLLRGAGLGAVLADDMGLGKTVQALAHLSVEHAAGRLDRPALVVCPTSVAPNWRAEAARFAPELRTLVLHGPARRERFGDIAVHDLVITTYPLLHRDAETLTGQEWSTVLLDEAHSIKNPAARTTLLARKLRGPSRIALTGTPIENNLGELWSLFDWVLPGYLGSRQGFARAWRTPIERGGDTARRGMLARRVQPFLLRRTKAEVASDLPPRTEILESIELGDGQRAIYEGIRLAMHAKVRQAIAERGLTRSGIIVLEALLRLRQACCDPRLLKLAAARSAKARSAKLERLMELLPELIAEGRRVLVFSQFTSMLTLIGQALDDAGLAFLQLTGRTRDREGVVRRFQAGEVPLFLVSLKAGGVGLNLTAADTVVHYDPWWNPAVEDQATDRAHRIGQDKPVFVHRLVALGTVEERMEALKARKQALAAGILGGAGAGALGMTEADIEVLFAPGDA